MPKLVRDNSGFMIERVLLIFLIIIALAVGISQYQKHGILGFILGFLITIAGIVAAVFALFGALDRIGYLHDRLHGKTWYKHTLKISQLILTFLFLSLWSMALMGIATLRFEVLRKIPEPVFPAIAFAAGAAATAISWFLKMSSGLTSGGSADFSGSQSPVHFSAWSSGRCFSLPYLPR